MIDFPRDSILLKRWSLRTHRGDSRPYLSVAWAAQCASRGRLTCHHVAVGVGLGPQRERCVPRPDRRSTSPANPTVPVRVHARSLHPPPEGAGVRQRGPGPVTRGRDCKRKSRPRHRRVLGDLRRGRKRLQDRRDPRTRGRRQDRERLGRNVDSDLGRLVAARSGYLVRPYIRSCRPSDGADWQPRRASSTMAG